MKTVGITGGIGSGKTTVCQLFSLMGIPIYDSDFKAKELMMTSLRGQVQDAFGAEAYIDGGLNRAFLAERVFSNIEELKKLNSIVHPAVISDFNGWVESQNSPYVIMESAIIFDAGLQSALDFMVTVSAPKYLRISRVMSRGGESEAQIEARIANQMSDEEREALADFTILNDGQALVWEQVLKLDKIFRKQ